VVWDTTTWLGIFLELNANGSDVLSGTGVKYTCLRHVHKRSENRMKVIQWLVGAWAKVYIAQSCRWKGRSLNCPETRWREVEDSQQSRRVTTCTTGEACLSKTSMERMMESRRQSYRRPRGEFAATRKKSSYPSDWQMALKRDCPSLQPTVWEYFVTLL